MRVCDTANSTPLFSFFRFSRDAQTASCALPQAEVNFEPCPSIVTEKCVVRYYRSGSASRSFLSSKSTAFTFAVTQYFFSAFPFDFGSSEISYLQLTNP